MKAKTIRMALGLAAALISLSDAAMADPYQHHRRTSTSGASPAYWGVERSPRSYQDCGGWCWTRLNPREASIRQLNPHLRAVSDGRLLEDVASPPPPAEVVEILPYSSGPVITVIPRRFFWHGAGHAHRFMRGRR